MYEYDKAVFSLMCIIIALVKFGEIYYSITANFMSKDMHKWWLDHEDEDTPTHIAFLINFNANSFRFACVIRKFRKFILR